MGTWIRHNQGMFVAVIITTALLIWTYGCESQVASLTEPTRKVTRAELNIELNREVQRLEGELSTLQQQAAVKMTQLDRQDELKRKLFEFAALTAEAGTFNPAGLVTLVGSLLGAGLLVDNRIKDKVIKNRPLPRATSDEGRETNNGSVV